MTAYVIIAWHFSHYLLLYSLNWILKLYVGIISLAYHTTTIITKYRDYHFPFHNAKACEFFAFLHTTAMYS